MNTKDLIILDILVGEESVKNRQFTGKIDDIELMIYDYPTHLPGHLGPWKNSGMPFAEFPVIRSMDLYYQ
jgi:hypothetical protein